MSLLGMFSLSSDKDEMRLWCFVKGVKGLILEMGDKDPKVSFFTGLIEMFGELSDKALRVPSGVPKLRVRVLINFLSCEILPRALEMEF